METATNVQSLQMSTSCIAAYIISQRDEVLLFKSFGV